MPTFSVKKMSGGDNYLEVRQGLRRWDVLSLEAAEMCTPGERGSVWKPGEEGPAPFPTLGLGWEQAQPPPGRQRKLGAK